MKTRMFRLERMEKSKVKPGSPNDAVEVMRILTRCNLRMRAQGIRQWDDIYPNLEVVAEDARKGDLFVLRDQGRITASICLNDQQPEQYATLPWKHITGRVLVVHRLCVDPDLESRGLGRRLMGFAVEFGLEHGFSCIRLEAYSGNPRALRFYEALGYQRVGQAWFPRRELPFECFERGF